MEIRIGEKYGCLEILDEGTDFLDLIDAKIERINKEKADFINAINNGEIEHDDWHGWNGKETVITPAFVYTPKNFVVKHHTSIREKDFDEAVSTLQTLRSIPHYRCKCRKCGKIRHYSVETIEISPQFCYIPMYCSQKHTYSISAQNANYRKRQKYANNESVLLVVDKDDVVPSDKYCEKRNEKRSEELRKQAEKDAQIIAGLPRSFAKNYDEDYVGTVYESLEVLECTNEFLESAPRPYYNQRHQKKYHPITVYKQYKCKCYLCGKEMITTCNKFGIYPPTEYGVTAYYGYWSDLYCDCHPISSFQWIVNKILLESNVSYRVEVTFPDLYGMAGKSQLRYDFGVFDSDGSILCLIECQGEQHYKPVDEFGGRTQFESQIKNDELKREYAQKHHIELVEISYKDKKYERVSEILKSTGII